MKRIFGLMTFCVFLASCSGNPPAWWNPGNRYGNTQTGSSRNAASVQRTAPAVSEETLDVFDESYEEIAITPMPDEDAENDTGVSASQNEELLPISDKLPGPSVLE